MSPPVGVVLMAYGTPRRPEDLEAYYTDIRRGRSPMPEQVTALRARYNAIGGLSPLAERTEAQRVALQAALDRLAPGAYVVALGLKHADPKIEAAVDELASQGVREAVGLVLAPHWSSLSVGEYLDRATAAGRSARVTVRAIESWHLEPAYLDFEAETVRRGLERLPLGTKVLFTAHSLPARVLDTGDPYPRQLLETAAAVAQRVGLGPWAAWGLAYQSAGRTPEPWLGPDVLQVIDSLAASDGATGLLVCACGFVADHLEVLYDLDIEARQRAEARGLAFARTACVNDDATVIAALAERVVAAAGP